MSEHIYFLGIGGTLMGSLAQLAVEMGYRVSGSDQAVYPPMSDQLAAASIEVFEGFDPAQMKPEPDLVVIGNAGLPRGHEAVEYVLQHNIPYTSGAEWLGRYVLPSRWVIAASGTHGKTTTASMLAWILDCAGMSPGYLIGGVPANLDRSARLGETPFFVVEADEYDTSYFDRRSKFVHYRPRTLLINNLEYDHADIFPDLAAIQTQFHHLLRAVPGDGLIIAPAHDDNVNEVLNMGCWTPVSRFGPTLTRLPIAMDNGDHWQAAQGTNDGSSFEILLNNQVQGRVDWPLIGEHNVNNALAVIAAARHVGVQPDLAIDALNRFEGVKRRMEVIATIGETTVYDDFAHHPTAIRTTLQGLRNKVGNEEIIAVVEPRSHTMSLGTLRNDLATCAAAADEVYWFRGDNIKWDLTELVQRCVIPAYQHDNLDRMISKLAGLPSRKRHIVIMSNGGFGGIYEKLPQALNA
jgi:UDP-N-acetylmuramate: L-alanyl-gamma-D-glutamyl-meso-diaminopimelate ligase